jgi:hypothetical protein
MGKITANADFGSFARRFVTAYWQEVIDYPGLEPIEQTLDELLGTMSWELQVTGDEHTIIMRNKAGDEWNFGFERLENEWKILKFNDTRKDLLAFPYDRYFRPMLERVVRSALA